MKDKEEWEAEQDFREAVRKCGNNATLAQILQAMKQAKAEREKKEK